MISYFQGLDLNTIAAVASAIAAISSVVVSCIFFAAQRKQANISKKVSVFDIRFEIYHCFKQLFKYSDYVAQDPLDLDDAKQQLNYLCVLDRIADDQDFLNGRSFRAAHNLLNHEAQVGGEKGHQADLNLYYLDEDVHKKIVSLKNQSVSTIEKGQFFFKQQLIPIMVTYVNVLFDYVDIFREGTAMESVRDSSQLMKAIDAVKQFDVIRRMEHELNVQ